MGVNLRPIVRRHVLELHDLKAKSFSVDGNNYLYQFLALIRMPDGSPLRDSNSNVTSHLVGLTFRTTRLMVDYRMHLYFTFDGKPSRLKSEELQKRRTVRDKATEDWKQAVQEGDYAKAFSKAVVTSRLTRSMVDDSKHLLSLLGIPFVQAPEEAEAQAAFMASRGDVWAASSKDYDSILFGAPRLVRFLTLTGKEHLPSKHIFRPLKPELITTQEILEDNRISHEQLVDLAILIGTDFNQGVKGIGPKKALKLVRNHGRLEDMPHEIRKELRPDYDQIREIFLHPNVNEDYSTTYGELREKELYSFLCEERDFSRDRVQTAIKRMREFYSWRRQADLERWLS